MKLLFLTPHAGWPSPRRDGCLPRFVEGVCRLFRSPADGGFAGLSVGNGFALRG
jgi:hypothetical protein